MSRVELQQPIAAGHDQLHQALTELAAAKDRYAATSAAERKQLAAACLTGIFEHADEWVAAASRAKGPPDLPSIIAEEIAVGPLATARYLRLIIQSLDQIAQTGAPRPPRVWRGRDGRVHVRVMPAPGLFDAIIFQGFSAEVVMQPEVTLENLGDHLAPQYRVPQYRAPQYRAPRQSGKVSLVLGAGNVGSIPATDAFSKLFEAGHVVLLKINPVNEYIGPIFERALAPLIEPGYLRIIYGDAQVGAAAVAHPLVDEVHITGSIQSHDAIVWGAGDDGQLRKRDRKPLLAKPITSELGNVSPWIIVPGRYSAQQLRFQAENVAASITNNASFNCLATKVIITDRNWPAREQFLDCLQSILADAPRRKAYYPGALDRFRRFAGQEPVTGEPLPWTLLRDVDPEQSPHLFAEESFVCVCAETALEAPSPAAFLARAVDFANDRLWGTLCAAITLPPDFRRQPAGVAALNGAIARLKYGAIGLNQWPGLVYAMMSPPWGGYPGTELHDIQSGQGWVHNTYLLEGIEKTILQGPLTVWPKPLWFPTHPNPELVARRLLDVYRRPSLAKLSRLLATAIWA